MIEFRDETDGWAAQVNRWIDGRETDAETETAAAADLRNVIAEQALNGAVRKALKAAVINPAVERFFEKKEEGKHMEDRAVYLGSLLFAIQDGGMLIRIMKPMDDAMDELETVYDGTADDFRPEAVGYDADVRVAGIRLRGDADTVGDVLEIILERK